MEFVVLLVADSVHFFFDDMRVGPRLNITICYTNAPVFAFSENLEMRCRAVIVITEVIAPIFVKLLQVDREARDLLQ